MAQAERVSVEQPGVLHVHYSLTIGPPKRRFPSNRTKFFERTIATFTEQELANLFAK